jgi:hypothetical protein
MSGPKMLVFSDVHLDAVTMGVPRFAELHETLGEIKSIAFERGCNSAVFNGDWCNPDTPRAWRCAEYAAEFAAGLKHDLGIESYWVNGNHDVVEDGHGTSVLSVLQSIDGVEVVSGPDEFVQDGVPIAFLPFTARAKSYDPERWAKNFEPETRWVFGHLNLIDFVPGSETEEMPRGRDVIWPLDALKARCPKAQLIGGHYHGGTLFGGVHIVGSPGIFTFGEEGNRPRVGVLSLESGEIEWVPLKTPYRFQTLSYPADGTPLEADVARCFVRLKHSKMLTEAEQVAIKERLILDGAAAVKLVLEVGETAAPRARARVVHNVADGDGLARTLAKDWATADQELSTAIEALVETCIGERVASS